MAAITQARPQLLPDLRMQMRLETHVIDDNPQVLEAVGHYGIDYVVFNNHLPEAQEMARNDPGRFAQGAAQTKRSAAVMMEVVRAANAQSARVPDAVAAIAAQLRQAGVTLGSHDDDNAETRAFFRGIGAPIAEFPTTQAAARAAHTAGGPVLMGAPNVVRGGSQSGNIAAEVLIGERVMRIETPRLILRRPLGGDLQAYWAYCASDRSRFAGGPCSRIDAFEKALL